MTPGELAQRLAELRLDETQAEALSAAATRLASAVRDALSSTPDGGTHDAPWLRSGVLRNSIGQAVDASSAVVGSSDPAAVFQECGTRTDPPRPFLAPMAAARAEELVDGLARTIVEGLR